MQVSITVSFVLKLTDSPVLTITQRSKKLLVLGTHLYVWVFSFFNQQRYTVPVLLIDSCGKA